MSQQRKKRKSYNYTLEEEASKPIIPDSDRFAVRKHIDEIK